MNLWISTSFQILGKEGVFIIYFFLNKNSFEWIFACKIAVSSLLQ